MTLVEEYRTEEDVIAGVPVRCTTYKIGQLYHCVVANQSPGANVARSSGSTREAALLAAKSDAERRISRARA